jgi:hypothetical protein
MLRAICWQSETWGEPPEEWFSKVESPQSLTELRLVRVGEDSVMGEAAAKAAMRRVRMLVLTSILMVVDYRCWLKGLCEV